MKYFILFLFPLFATTLNAQTEFAPIGAEWAYNKSEPFYKINLAKSKTRSTFASL